MSLVSVHFSSVREADIRMTVIEEGGKFFRERVSQQLYVN